MRSLNSYSRAFKLANVKHFVCMQGLNCTRGNNYDSDCLS